LPKEETKFVIAVLPPAVADTLIDGLIPYAVTESIPVEEFLSATSTTKYLWLASALPTTLKLDNTTFPP
jgi:hypothetical protein